MSSKQLSTLAKNIRKLRKEKNISQDKLSKMAGIAHNTVVKIESGLIRNPKIETVQKIAKAFGVSLDDLVKP